MAIAPGKIVPSGRTKLIQPFETGVVRAIHVQDEQSVKAGDILIELDPTMSAAELGHHVAGEGVWARLVGACGGRGGGILRTISFAWVEHFFELGG